MEVSRRLTSIMFTDIVGYTAMMQEDKAHAMEVAARHESVLLVLVPGFGGEVQNFMGDGSLCLFETNTDALSCARQIQIELQDQVPLRIGIHDGEVTIKDGRAYGDGVNIASRIESSGHGGLILFSRSVFEKVQNDTSFDCRSIGLFRLKNVADPQELFTLIDDQLAPANYAELSNRYHPWYRRKSRALLVALVITAVAIILGNYIIGATDFPDSLHEERIAVAIYDNQTGDSDLDVLGPYFSSVLSRGFQKLDDIKLCDYESVKDHIASLGILPGNPQKKPSFYELTNARYTIEGRYFLRNTDSVELHISMVDKLDGAQIYQLEPFLGDLDNKEAMATELQEMVLGYWVSKDHWTNRPTNYSAFMEFQKGMNTSYSMEWDKAKGHFDKCVELDPDFVEAYWQILTLYELGGVQSIDAMDSVISIIERKSDILTREEHNEIRIKRFELHGDFQKAFPIYYQRYKKDPVIDNHAASISALKNNYVPTAIEILEHIEDSKRDYYNLPIAYQYRLGQMARAYNKMGQFQKTIEAMNQHFPPHSNYVRVPQMLVLAYVQLGMDDELMRLAETRRGLERGNKAFIYHQAALRYYMKGDQEAVERYFELARNCVEFDSTELGDYYFLLGQYEDSKIAYERIHAQHPDGVAIKVMLAVLELHQPSPDTSLVNTYVNFIKEHGQTSHINYDGPMRVIPYALALIEGHRGNLSTAMEHVHDAFRSGVFFTYDRYDWDALMKPLFNYPPFQEFVRPKAYDE